MHVIVLAVELNEFCFEVAAHVREDQAQFVYHLFREYAASVLGYKDQVHVHHKDAVPTMPQLRVCAARAAHNFPLRRFRRPK